MGRKGGLQKAYSALTIVAPFAPDVLPEDLETVAGGRAFMARLMAAVARLPLDVRVGNCLGQLWTAQRATIEVADFERRLQALEAAVQAGQPLRRTS